MKDVKETDIISKEEVRRLQISAKAITQIRKQFDWLQKNGIQFVEPLHKTIDECEAETNRRFPDENDKCSNEWYAFLQGAFWASNNE